MDYNNKTEINKIKKSLQATYNLPEYLEFKINELNDIFAVKDETDIKAHKKAIQILRDILGFIN